MDQPRRSPFFLKGIHHTAVCHTYMVLHAGQYSIGPRNPGIGLGDPRHILTVQSPSCSFHCGMTGCHHCSGFWMVPQSIRNSGGRVYWEQILRPCIRHIPLHEACSGAGAKTLFIVAINDGSHVVQTAVAALDIVSVEQLMVPVMFREMLVHKREELPGYVSLDVLCSLCLSTYFISPLKPLFWRASS